MAEIILLSDNLSSGHVGDSRYVGPYAVASQLEMAGFDVAVIDYFTRLPDLFGFLHDFLGPETLMVGVSTTFLSAPNPAPHLGRSSTDTNRLYLWLDSAEELRSWFAGLRALLDQRASRSAPIVLGGGKALFAEFDREAYSHVNYISLGDSDQSMVEVATELRARRVPKHIQTSRGTPILDNFSYLGQKHCPQTGFSPKHAVRQGESLPLEVSRGCLFNCKFCSFEKRTSARKDPEILIEEVIRNYENFGTTVYHFCDDCFNDSRPKVESVCNALARLPFKIEWVSYARTDLGVRVPETMEMMIQSGAAGLYFGIESFDSEVARRAGKGVPSEKVKEFLISFREKYGDRCLLQGSFIVGLPGETEQSILATRDWLLENPALDFVCIGPLELSPYMQKLDKQVIDYSDYERNPGTYGFKNVSFNPTWWEHETFNSLRAKEISESIFSAWREKHDTFLRSIWRYPLMRTLGYSKEEVFAMARCPESSSRWEREVPERFKEFVSEYHESLSKSMRRAPLREARMMEL